MKRPAFQFYPADWRKDNELRSCSAAARGLWIEMLVLAHECAPYGHLMLNGTPMDSDTIARLTAMSGDECERLIGELEVRGVFSRNPKGAIFCRRMVRDEEIRNSRADGGKKGAEYGQKGAEHGSKGGRPLKERGVNKPPLNPPPSSSSSISSSELNIRFGEFWLAYPRKEAKSDAEEAFKKAVLEADPCDIVSAASAYAQAESSKKTEPKFLLYPVKWLEKKRWLDFPQRSAEEIASAKDRADRIMRRGKYASV